jgi:hypothetical protein
VLHFKQTTQETRGNQQPSQDFMLINDIRITTLNIANPGFGQASGVTHLISFFLGLPDAEIS